MFLERKLLSPMVLQGVGIGRWVFTTLERNCSYSHGAPWCCGILGATLYYYGYDYVLQIYEVLYRIHLLIFIVVVYALSGCTQCSDKGQPLNCYSDI